MKICLFVPSMVSGGAERVVSHLANHWADSHQVYLVTLAGPSLLPFYPIASNVVVLQTGLLSDDKSSFQKILRYLKQIIGIIRVFRRISPDVVIAFLDISIFLALVARFLVKTKVIVSERNNPFSSVTNKWLKKINYFLYRYADQLIIQTHQLAARFPKRLRHKITVIPNPVLPPAGQITDYMQAHQQNQIVTLGRLHPQKGHDVLIKAFSSLVPRYPSWRLMLIGDGEEREHLEQMCTQYNISEQVTFFGRSHQPEKLLLKSSIFVLPSRYEGFPNALCEAMAMGLPSVATDCQFGPREIITDHRDGLLVAPEDAHALTEALQLLMTDLSLYQQLGANAKNIADRLAIDQVAGKWEDVIHSLSKQPS